MSAKVKVFNNAENAATARRMLANGMTDRVVADTFGVDRSTVAWFRRRHSIPASRPSGKNEHRRVEFVPPVSKPADTRLLKGPAWRALPGTAPVTLVDLEPGMCKWPIGTEAPYHFCGAECEGSYCETHAAMSRGIGTASERVAHKARVR